jgi:restriction system protein
MKFKMSPNSLFARLLRSPWWISMSIALAYFAAAQALLPPEYRLLGAAGALPFAVLGLIALKRQWNAPSARQIESVLTTAAGLGWNAFGAAVEQAFRRDGYEVQRLSGAEADLLLTRGGRHTLVLARRWKAARVGEEALQSLRAAADARDDGSACLYITLGELSPQAQRVADSAPVQVMQGPALVRLLRGML